MDYHQNILLKTPNQDNDFILFYSLTALRLFSIKIPIEKLIHFRGYDTDVESYYNNI